MKSTGQRIRTDDPRVAFEKRIVRGPGCWEWDGAKHPFGYGQLTVASKLRLAHRVAYELYIGPIPKGMEIDHLCRNPGCANPAHLEAVTHRENLRRGRGWSGVNAQKTKCVNGHHFTPENTYLYPNGRHRRCRECARLSKLRMRRTDKGHLTPEQVRVIRWGGDNGLSYQDLAEIFDVSPTTAWNIVNRKSWRAL